MSTTTLETLCEIIVQPSSGRVDRHAGIIRGVRILRPQPDSGRRYLGVAIRDACSLYEGRPVGVNPPSQSAVNFDRPIQDRVGWLKSVRLADGGLSGDLHFLTTHPLTPMLLEAARRNPRIFGLSVNMDGRTRREGGKIIVKEIARVRSVDLVPDPVLDVGGLFESRESIHPLVDGRGAASSASDFFHAVTGRRPPRSQPSRC